MMVLLAGLCGACRKWARRLGGRTPSAQLLSDEPTSVADGFLDVAVGNESACAVGADGGVVCWGAGLPESGIRIPDVHRALSVVPLFRDFVGRYPDDYPANGYCAYMRDFRVVCWSLEGGTVAITETRPGPDAVVVVPASARLAPRALNCGVWKGRFACVDWVSGGFGQGPTASVDHLPFSGKKMLRNGRGLGICALDTQRLRCGAWTGTTKRGFERSFETTVDTEMHGLGDIAVDDDSYSYCVVDQVGVRCAQRHPDSTAREPTETVRSLGPGHRIAISGRDVCVARENEITCAHALFEADAGDSEVLRVRTLGRVRGLDMQRGLVCFVDDAGVACFGTHRLSSWNPEVVRVPLDSPAVAIGREHMAATCAVLADGGVSCWGRLARQPEDMLLNSLGFQAAVPRRLPGVGGVQTFLKHPGDFVLAYGPGGLYVWQPSERRPHPLLTSTVSKIVGAGSERFYALSDGAGTPVYVCDASRFPFSIRDGLGLWRLGRLDIDPVGERPDAEGGPACTAVESSEIQSVRRFAARQSEDADRREQLRSTLERTGLPVRPADVVDFCTTFDVLCVVLRSGTVQCGRVLKPRPFYQTEDRSHHLVDPALTGSLRQARAITCGDNHACILDAEGAVYCWGWPFDGALGNASEFFVREPHRLPVPDRP